MIADAVQDHRLDIARRAVQAAGDVIQAAFHRPHILHKKGPSDLVTDVDYRAQDAALQVIRSTFPEEGLLAEEADTDQPGAHGVWVVDPLDGTSNFVQGIPHVSVSVAFVSSGRPQVGVVYDPLRREVFSAQRGVGAWLNGEPMSIRPTRPLRDAVILTGAENRGFGSPNLDTVVEIFSQIGSVRVLGSAALDLAYVACGRADVMVHHILGPWDKAAGALLVEAAGGTVTAVTGAPLDVLELGSMLAGNPDLHAQICAGFQSGE